MEMLPKLTDRSQVFKKVKMTVMKLT